MKSVLIVDDDDLNLEYLTAYLEIEGHHVVTAHDGKMALNFLGLQVFDLILLDMSLPDVRGDEVARAIRARRIYTPILVISGYTDEATIANAKASGADDYLPRPFDGDVFYHRVHRLLQGRSN